MQDHGAEAGKTPEDRMLTVDEARAFYETRSGSSLTRSGVENPFPFVLGFSDPDWVSAGISSTHKLSSVDIHVDAEYEYMVLRENRAGVLYAVPASSKLIVVKSNVTDSLGIYIRVCIPDESYAALYDANICNMTLNCEDRGDYCGLEYYATLEGLPVAAACYLDGKYTDGVFLFDKSLPSDERVSRFGSLLGNVWIRRVAAHSPTRSSDPEWNYGQPGDIFIDSNGGVYMYVDTNGDGKADAVTQLLFWNVASSDNGGGGSGPGNPGIPTGPTGPAGPGGPGTPGDTGGGNVGGGGSSGGNSGNEDNNDEDDGKRDDLPIIVIDPPWRITPIDDEVIDPIPWDPISPGILPPRDDGRYKKNKNILTDDPEIIKLLDKLFEDCMGALLVGTVTDRVTIGSGGAVSGDGELRVTPVKDSNGNWSYNKYDIQLNVVDYFSLIEELLHLHQYSGKDPSSVFPYKMNNEIEAKLAWYMYGIKYDVFDADTQGGYIGRYKGIDAFEGLRKHYTKNDMNSLDFFNAYAGAVHVLRSGYLESKYPCDWNRTSFPILQGLMKDC